MPTIDVRDELLAELLGAAVPGGTQSEGIDADY